MTWVSDQRGFALVAVLAGVLVLALIAVSLSSQSRTGLNLTRYDIQRARESAALDAGINRGIYELLRETNPTEQIHGREISSTIEDLVVLTTIEDEAGRVDINAASTEVLAQLLSSIGLPLDEALVLADRIADWRDEDDLVRPNGAEALSYRAEELNPPGNRAFLTVSETEAVLGMTPEIVSCLLPFITLYAGRQSPDPRFMSSEMRALFGSSEVDEQNGNSVPITTSPATLSPRGRVYLIRSIIEGAPGLGRQREAVVRVTGHRTQPFWIYFWGDRRNTAGLGCVLELE